MVLSDIKACFFKSDKIFRLKGNKSNQNPLDQVYLNMIYPLTDSKYFPIVRSLFTPKASINHVDPTDYPPQDRKTCNITGLVDVLQYSKLYKEEQKQKDVDMETNDEKDNKDSEIESTTNTDSDKLVKSNKQKERNHYVELQKKLTEWNPESDPHITGDPYKSLFIGRLDYSVTEVELQQKFSVYGEIDKIRVVRDKTTNNSRGYGFILFKHESDAKNAHLKANRLEINNRKIVVDIERGRTVKNWKPQRLGGGLGGRGYSKVELKRAQVTNNAGAFHSHQQSAGQRNTPLAAKSGSLIPQSNSLDSPAQNSRFQDHSSTFDRPIKSYGPPSSYKSSNPTTSQRPHYQRDRHHEFPHRERDPRDRDPRDVDPRNRNTDSQGYGQGYRERDSRYENTGGHRYEQRPRGNPNGGQHQQHQHQHQYQQPYQHQQYSNQGAGYQRNRNRRY